MSGIFLNGSTIASTSPTEGLNTHITDCITEIPQDIKLELNNSTLTLKAGSTVYFPNGVNNFDPVVISDDTTHLQSLWGVGQYLVLYNRTNIEFVALDSMYSGTTAPTARNGLWFYDTNNNQIKTYRDNNNKWNIQDISLPLGIVTSTDGSTIASLDQIFNGFGYIGSTIFALPGVKGLIPNGRNENGEVKSALVTSNHVLIYNYAGTETALFNLQFFGNSLAVINNNNYFEQDNLPPNIAWTVWYNTLENKKYVGDGSAWSIQNTLDAGTFKVENGKIVWSNFKKVFKKLDMNDTSFIAQQAMPSNQYINLTLGADSSQYTIPANGYLCLTGIGNWVSLSINKSLLQTGSRITDTPQQLSVYLPVKKDNIVQINYQNLSQTQAWHVFRFIYAEGEI